MPITKKLLFVLIGNDKTGKTTFQKRLIEKLHGITYESLKCNKAYNVKEDLLDSPFKISYANRSYQEKSGDYGGTVDKYFSDNHFNPTDVAVISSHLNKQDVEDILRNGKERFYNVIGVFFTNSITTNLSMNAQISALNWDERLVVENPHASGALIDKQLNENADSFADLLIKRIKG
ncbi:MAG: hypothetical protein E2604_10865 [Flavobacterium sp.]|nr:hypothetical protein [Flavobacterium sp.]